MLSIPTVVSLLGLSATALSAPNAYTKRAQTVYLAGDSTMAKASGVTTGTIEPPPSPALPSNILERLGRLLPLLRLPPRGQQGHRRPQRPLLHRRKPL